MADAFVRGNRPRCCALLLRKLGGLWALGVTAALPLETCAALSNAERRAVSVFVEAEDFALPDGWQTRTGHGIDMYSPPVSGGETVHNSAAGTAVKDVVIPKDGAYTVWLWFTKWVLTREFEFSIEQDGKTVAAASFDRPKDQLANWFYHAQKADAPAVLKAGPAKLSIATKFPVQYVGSPLDCVLLTMDAEYAKPKWQDFAPQCFVRFQASPASLPPMTLGVCGLYHTSPYYFTAPEITGTNGGAVPAGAMSEWCDVGAALSPGRQLTALGLTCKSGTNSLPSRWRLKLEFASAPEDRARFLVLDDEWDGTSAGYVMPGDLVRYWKEVPVESFQSITARHLKFAKSLRLPGGKKDLRPRILTIEADVNVPFSDRLLAQEHEVLKLLGINSVNIEGAFRQKAAQAAGMDLEKGIAYRFIQGNISCSFNTNEQRWIEDVAINGWVESIRRNDPVLFRKVGAINLADEPSAPNGLEHMTKCANCAVEFRAWLRGRGKTPSDFGATDWGQIKPVRLDPKADVLSRRLGWYSSVFAQETSPLPYRRATAALQKAFGRPIATRINFYALNGWDATMSRGDGLNWFEFERMGATTMPWTEDMIFKNPHVTGFFADLLRSTETTKSIPLGMYIHYGISPLNDPNSPALRTMAAVARGVKDLHHYWYGPEYMASVCAFSDNEPYVRSVAYVNRVLGLADDLLGPARVPDRDVAILWSQAAEEWAYGEWAVERRMLHYALSMQQFPVDLICEKDVPARLRQYKVVFLPTSHLDSSILPAMEEWVNGGGVLVVSGGGPGFDEVNEPLPRMRALQGLASVTNVGAPIQFRMEVCVPPTTEASVEGVTGRIGVAAGYYTLNPTSDAVAVGTYTNGGTAVVERRLGKGRVLTLGFAPGISLLTRLDPKPYDGSGFWTVFPEAEMSLIVRTLSRAGVSRLVETRVGVDAARLDGPAGSVVTLANFTLQPIPKLSVRVRGAAGIRKIESTVHGRLRFERQNDALCFDLPLETVDVVKLHRQATRSVDAARGE